MQLKYQNVLVYILHTDSFAIFMFWKIVQGFTFAISSVSYEQKFYPDSRTGCSQKLYCPVLLGQHGGL